MKFEWSFQYDDQWLAGSGGLHLGLSFFQRVIQQDSVQKKLFSVDTFRKKERKKKERKQQATPNCKWRQT